MEKEIDVAVQLPGQGMSTMREVWLTDPTDRPWTVEQVRERE